MNYASFSKDLWHKIETALAEEKEHLSMISAQSDRPVSRPRPVAAFDADGTLWDTDLGENFFQFEVKEKLLDGLPQNAWQFYRVWKKKNPRGAYLWLAQIHQGLLREQVLTWASSALPKPIPIFPEMLKLIEFFKKNEVEIYIVTASVSWAIQPAARFLGLDPQQVIGVETLVKSDLISAEVGPALTYRKGKAEAILSKTANQKPFFCAGNTLGDFDLLKESSRLSLAVTGTKSDSELYPQEMQLQAQAQKHGWLTHQF